MSQKLLQNVKLILYLNTKTSKQGLATINLTFDVKSKEELNNLIKKIRQVDSIIDISRATG